MANPSEIENPLRLLEKAASSGRPDTVYLLADLYKMPEKSRDPYLMRAHEAAAKRMQGMMSGISSAAVLVPEIDQGIHDVLGDYFSEEEDHHLEMASILKAKISNNSGINPG